MVILLICSLKLESITQSLVTTSINLFLQAVSNSESPDGTFKIHLLFFYKHQVNSAQPQICLNLNNRPYYYKNNRPIVFQPTSEPQYAWL